MCYLTFLILMQKHLNVQTKVQLFYQKAESVVLKTINSQHSCQKIY